MRATTERVVTTVNMGERVNQRRVPSIQCGQKAVNTEGFCGKEEAS